MAVVITALIIVALMVLVVAMCVSASRADEHSERAYNAFLQRQADAEQRRLERERERAAPMSDMVHRGAVPETNLPSREGLRIVRSGD